MAAKNYHKSCSICSHEKAKEINKLIAKGVTGMTIAGDYGMAKSSVYRHIETCLQIDIQAAREDLRMKSVIDVAEEFAQQLAFAKELREQAKAILSDPNDPLKLTLVPQAHEIEVVYYDHNDLFMGQPKRKKAMLSVILESLPEAASIEPSKFTIKTIDIRKFALEALSTADMCIDKFARMGGAYKRQEDSPDVGELADKLVERLVQKGWEQTAAREFAQQKYGGLKLVR